MATRKALQNGEENPQKRQRVSEGVNHHDAAPDSSFESLNNDCLVNIFSYLPTEDLNNVAMVNQACSEARNNEYLDQTRTATIVCSAAKGSTVSSFYATLGNASNTLPTNYTKFKIVGMENLEEERSMKTAVSPLVNVIALELALHQSEEEESTMIPENVLQKLSQLLPNVADLILDGVNLSGGLFSHYNFSAEMRNLSRISWQSGRFHVSGFCLGSNVRELALDNCVFEFIGDDYSVHLEILSDQEYRSFLLCHCRHLERLSMNDTTLSIDDGQKHAITQGMLLKMIRGLPNLRWLKSDLTQENIAILQQERPDVTFVQNE